MDYITVYDEKWASIGVCQGRAGPRQAKTFEKQMVRAEPARQPLYIQYAGSGLGPCPENCLGWVWSRPIFEILQAGRHRSPSPPNLVGRLGPWPMRCGLYIGHSTRGLYVGHSTRPPRRPSDLTGRPGPPPMIFGDYCYYFYFVDYSMRPPACYDGLVRTAAHFVRCVLLLLLNVVWLCVRVRVGILQPQLRSYDSFMSNRLECTIIKSEALCTCRVKSLGTVLGLWTTLIAVSLPWFVPQTGLLVQLREAGPNPRQGALFYRELQRRSP